MSGVVTQTVRPGGQVVVVGSANLDYVTRVPRLPAAGETVLAESASVGLGGKGMNQAVAAALLGAGVRFVGAVGDDDAGERIRSALTSAGVDGSGVRRVPGLLSGAAYIAVDPAGENCIVVAPGANAAVDADQVRAALAEVPAGAVFVAQLEVPVEAVAAVATIAAERSGRFVLNLAPYGAVPGDVLAAADPLIVNETEALGVLGLAGSSNLPAAEFEEVAAELARRCRSVVITAGARGALVAAAGDLPCWLPAPPAEVVDSTGAGDAFVGALAAALAADVSLVAAAARAVAAASASVGAAGAQSSYPQMAAAVLGP